MLDAVTYGHLAIAVGSEMRPRNIMAEVLTRDRNVKACIAMALDS